MNSINVNVVISFGIQNSSAKSNKRAVKSKRMLRLHLTRRLHEIYSRMSHSGIQISNFRFISEIFLELLFWVDNFITCATKRCINSIRRKQNVMYSRINGLTNGESHYVQKGTRARGREREHEHAVYSLYKTFNYICLTRYVFLNI